MILSAGLTPAWQQILVFESFQVGEVNRAVQAQWCASGKVLNAGIAAHHLGGPSRTLAPLGGAAGSQISAEFTALNVPYRWVPTAAATRVCTTILDRSRGAITELVENGRPLSAAELDAFYRAYLEQSARAEAVVLIGSLPLGTPETFYRRLLQSSRCPAVLDFRGEGLLSVLDLKPAVVKPNREELSRTVGHELTSDAELLTAMRWLNQRGAQAAVVTQGSEPVWVSTAGAAWRLLPSPLGDLVNPIGSGDALAATLAWALRGGRPLIDAVRLGMAAAAQNARQLLPCRLDPQSLEAEAASIQVDPVA